MDLLAWNSIPAEKIKNIFLNVVFPKTMDGSEDDALYEENFKETYMGCESDNSDYINAVNS